MRSEQFPLKYANQKCIIISKKKRRYIMAEYMEYGKPCMTNLPYDLGVKIFEQILNTPRPDYDKMEEEANRLEQEIVKIRKEENAQKLHGK